MNRYHVFSQQGDKAVLEVTRSDRKVAEQDVSIISGMFRRSAWLEDSQSQAAQEVSRAAA